MRIDVKKILFLGPVSQQDQFFKACQKAGIVQFIGPKVSSHTIIAQQFQDCIQAIKILHHYHVQASSHTSVSDPIGFAHQILADKQQLDELASSIERITEELAIVSPLGEIPLETIAYIQKHSTHSLHCYYAASSKHAAQLSDQLIHCCSTQSHDYFLSTQPLTIDGLNEILLDEHTAQLSQILLNMQNEYQDLDLSLKDRAIFTEGLKHALCDHVNTIKRTTVIESANIAVQDTIFTIHGWVSNSHYDQIQHITEELGIIADEIDIQKEDTPPTCLENTNFGKLGESLVSIYDTPSATDKDPSLWVLGFFALFFSMIVCDAGYGLVFALSALLLQKNRAPSQFLKLTTILGVSCIVWGLCTNSFFGLALDKENPVRKYSLLTYLVEKRAEFHFTNNDSHVQQWTKNHGSPPTSIHDFLYTAPTQESQPLYKQYCGNCLLELSLFIGSLHIICGLIRYLPRNISHAGWILFIIGGYLYCVDYLQATSLINYLFGINSALASSIGLQLVGGGMSFALIASVFSHGIGGMHQLMTAIQIFSDILSYLRLYALGLSGSIVAEMINEMAHSAPFLLAVALWLIAHAVNMSMAIMGGVIHGLRLNFLEWYHYSFEGGGKPFSPLNIEPYQ